MGAAYQRGLILHRQRRYELAIEEFRKELAATPNDAGSHAMLALCYADLGQSPAAHAEAEAAIAANPTYAFAHYVMAYVTIKQQSIALEEARRHGWGTATLATDYKHAVREAVPHADESLRLSPRNAEFLAMAAALQLDLRHHAAALKLADRGLECNPRHLGCANLRAKVLRQTGRVDEAKNTLNLAVEVNPEHPATRAGQGWNALHAKEYRQAVDHFTESLRLNPEDPAAQRGLKLARRARNPFLRPFVRLRLASPRVRLFWWVIWVAFVWLINPAGWISRPVQHGHPIALLSVTFLLILLLGYVVIGSFRRSWKRRQAQR
jgi:tetratricopeptide (TPR) repeat protein